MIDVISTVFVLVATVMAISFVGLLILSPFILLVGVLVFLSRISDNTSKA